MRLKNVRCAWVTEQQKSPATKARSVSVLGALIVHLKIPQLQVVSSSALDLICSPVRLQGGISMLILSNTACRAQLWFWPFWTFACGPPSGVCSLCRKEGLRAGDDYITLAFLGWGAIRWPQLGHACSLQWDPTLVPVMSIDEQEDWGMLTLVGVPPRASRSRDWCVGR